MRKPFKYLVVAMVIITMCGSQLLMASPREETKVMRAEAKVMTVGESVPREYINVFEVPTVSLTFAGPGPDGNTGRYFIIGGTNEDRFIGSKEDKSTGFILFDLNEKKEIERVHLNYLPERIWVANDGRDILVISKQQWGKQEIIFFHSYSLSYANSAPLLNSVAWGKFFPGEGKVDFDSSETRFDGKDIYFQVKSRSTETDPEEKILFTKRISYMEMFKNLGCLYLGEDYQMSWKEQIEESCSRDWDQVIKLLGMGVSSHVLYKETGQFGDWDMLSKQYIPSRFTFDNIGGDYQMLVFDVQPDKQSINVIIGPNSIVLQDRTAFGMSVSVKGNEKIFEIFRFDGNVSDFQKWHQIKYLPMQRAGKGSGLFMGKMWEPLDIEVVKEKLEERGRLSLRALGQCELAYLDTHNEFGMWDDLVKAGNIEAGFTQENFISGYDVSHEFILMKDKKLGFSRVIMIATPLGHIFEWGIYAMQCDKAYASKGNKNIYHPELEVYRFRSVNYSTFTDWLIGVFLPSKDEMFFSLQYDPNWERVR